MKRFAAVFLILALLFVSPAFAAGETEPSGRYELSRCVVEGENMEPQELGAEGSYVYIGGVNDGSPASIILIRDGVVSSAVGIVLMSEETGNCRFVISAAAGEPFEAPSQLLSEEDDGFDLAYSLENDELALTLEGETYWFAVPGYDEAVRSAMESMAETLALFSMNDEVGGAILSDSLTGSEYTLAMTMTEGGASDSLEVPEYVLSVMKDVFAACGDITLKIEVRSGNEVVTAMATPEEVESIQEKIRSQLREGDLASDKEVLNILLIGTDARDVDEQARSDVMMLVSLNRNTRKIILTSFMRDIYTYIPDYGYNRLNLPYVIGGAECLIETLESSFGVDIDNYVAVNFFAFADAVDAVGGIDLELSRSEVDFINRQAYSGEQKDLGVGDGPVYLEYSEDGWYHIDGTQTLAHCRNRSSIGSDFDRTSRQRDVISALMERLKSISLSQAFKLITTVLPTVTTDLSLGDCLSLLFRSGQYLKYDVETCRVPGDTEYSGAMIDGMAVLVVDFDAASARVHETIYG